MKVVWIHLHGKFQTIPSMHSPENVQKPWISLIQNCTKIRNINRTWPPKERSIKTRLTEKRNNENKRLKLMLRLAGSTRSMRGKLPLTHWGRDKMDTIFKWILLNENLWILIKISLKFVTTIPTLVQIMAWCQTGDKPLSQPMRVSFTDPYIRHSASMS